jgi:hypothetical protein
VRVGGTLVAASNEVLGNEVFGVGSVTTTQTEVIDYRHAALQAAFGVRGICNSTCRRFADLDTTTAAAA